MNECRFRGRQLQIHVARDCIQRRRETFERKNHWISPYFIHTLTYITVSIYFRGGSLLPWNPINANMIVRVKSSLTLTRSLRSLKRRHLLMVQRTGSMPSSITLCVQTGGRVFRWKNKYMHSHGWYLGEVSGFTLPKWIHSCYKSPKMHKNKPKFNGKAPKSKAPKILHGYGHVCSEQKIIAMNHLRHQINEAKINTQKRCNSI